MHDCISSDDEPTASPIQYENLEMKIPSSYKDDFHRDVGKEDLTNPD